jgi:hypothetical protein
MSIQWIRACVIFCCTAAAVTASEKSKASLENYSHALSFDRNAKIKARKITLSLKNGKDCSHVAKYENGEIVTRIGGLGLGSGSASINLAGDQTVTMYSESGQVCFASVSKEWELQDKIVIHRHEGFDVYTDKKEQCVVIR